MPIHRRTLVQTADVARPASPQPQMPGAGRDIGVSAQNLLAVFRFADADLTACIHPSRERTAEQLWNMLRNDDTRGVRRQAHQDFLDRLGTAGRRADRNDALGRPELALRVALRE